MGAWSTSILGNDDADDWSYKFDKEFGDRQPTTAETDAFLGETLDTIPRYVTAWKVMERAAPISQRLKDDALAALQSDIDYIVEGDNPEGWEDPEKRIAALTQFREMVSAYPLRGSKVALPTHMGLLETIYNGMGDDN